jgi:hypothetical protein
LWYVRPLVFVSVIRILTPYCHISVAFTTQTPLPVTLYSSDAVQTQLFFFCRHSASGDTTYNRSGTDGMSGRMAVAGIGCT